MRKLFDVWCDTGTLTSGNKIRMSLVLGSMSLVKQRGRNYSSITFHKFTKIAEWQTFLLQVSGILFFYEHLLPQQDVCCLLYLIRGIELLSSLIVTEEQLLLSQLFLFVFAQRYPALYTSLNVTWSFHSILHLPFWVRVWGRLLVFTLFPTNVITADSIGELHRAGDLS